MIIRIENSTLETRSAFLLSYGWRLAMRWEVLLAGFDSEPSGTTINL